MKILGIVAAAAIAVGASASANAATLNATLATDNIFSLYISTNDSIEGTLIASGSNWTTPVSLTHSFSGSPVYYLHLVGQNSGSYNSNNPAAFVGQFSISGGGYEFSNNTTSLLTNTTNWNADDSSTGSWLTGPSGTPINLGTNGGSNIWTSHNGTEAGISTSADWIWSPTASSQYALFSTVITATGGAVATTPLPASWTMLLAALIGFGFLGWLKKAKKNAFAGLAAA